MWYMGFDVTLEDLLNPASAGLMSMKSGAAGGPCVQRTCVDKILGLGECPPKDLKIEEEWGPEDLNLRLFFLFF